jgi:hypothetical protein
MEENRQGVLLTCCMLTGDGSYIFKIRSMHIGLVRHTVHNHAKREGFFNLRLDIESIGFILN